MTKKEIEKGAGLHLPLSADVSRWWNYFAPPSITGVSRKDSKISRPRAAGFTRIHHIWTEGIPDVPKLFMGSPIQDRDMARGTLMALSCPHNGLSGRNHSDSGICGVKPVLMT